MMWLRFLLSKLRAMFNSETLDDTPVPEDIRSFEGGMVSNVRPNAIADNESAYLVNMQVSKRGFVQTRRGLLRLPGSIYVEDGSGFSGGRNINGAFFYDTISFKYLIMSNNNYLWRYTGSGWVLLSPVYSAFGGFTTMVQGNDILYLTTPGNNLWSWNGTSFANLGNRVGPGVSTFPPNSPSFIVWHTQRLVAGGMALSPDTVEFSNFLNGSQWNFPDQALRVGGGDGDPITGLVGWTDFNLVVLKRHSIWLIDCNPQAPVAEFQIRRIHPFIGTVAPRTAVQVGSDIFVLTDHGVRSIRRTIAAENQEDIGPSLSEPVDDIIARINQAAIGLSNACYWNNRYFLSVALDSSPTCNTVLVYNTLTSTWDGIWTGWNATCFTIRAIASGATRLIVGTTNGKALEWQDYIAPANETVGHYRDESYDGATTVPIPSDYISRAMEFGSGNTPKTGLNLEVEYDFNSFSEAYPAATNTFVSRMDDEKAGVEIGKLVSPRSPQRVALDLQAGGQFQELQARITTTGGKVTIRRVRAAAFHDTMELQTAYADAH